MLKLNLLQNGYHSLYHAVEHLELAEQAVDLGKEYDEDGFVSWKDGKGHLNFWGGKLFTKPPNTYHYKFAILHLIQALELIIKGYIHQQNPNDIFRDKSRTYTIGLVDALKKLITLEPSLLSPQQVALVQQAKDIRNAIEHYMFSFRLEEARAISLDFLALCNYLTYRLFCVTLTEEWSWEPWTNDFDPIVETLGGLLAELGSAGTESKEEVAKLWASRNAKDTIYLCVNCRTRSASVSQGTCVVCGEVTDEEVGNLIDELEEISTHINQLRKIGIKLREKGIELPSEMSQLLDGNGEAFLNEDEEEEKYA